MTSSVIHEPARPGWNCEGCEQPWPCETARAELIEEYGGPRVMLFLDLGLYFNDAAEDFFEHTGALPAELYERIVLWPRAYFPKPAA